MARRARSTGAVEGGDLLVVEAPAVEAVAARVEAATPLNEPAVEAAVEPASEAPIEAAVAGGAEGAGAEDAARAVSAADDTLERWSEEEEPVAGVAAATAGHLWLRSVGVFQDAAIGWSDVAIEAMRVGARLVVPHERRA